MNAGFSLRGLAPWCATVAGTVCWASYVGFLFWWPAVGQPLPAVFAWGAQYHLGKTAFLLAVWRLSGMPLPARSDWRRPSFWLGGGWGLNNPLFNLVAPALGGPGILLLESWPVTASAVVAFATGTAGRLLSPGWWLPFGLAWCGVALSVAGGAGFADFGGKWLYLALGLVSHVLTAQMPWGSLWAASASGVAVRRPGGVYGLAVLWSAYANGACGLVNAGLWLALSWAGDGVAWLDGRGALICLVCVAVTGCGDLLYRLGLRYGDGVALQAPALLLPAMATMVSVWASPAGAYSLGWVFWLGVALLALGNGLLLWRGDKD